MSIDKELFEELKEVFKLAGPITNRQIEFTVAYAIMKLAKATVRPPDE